MKEDAIQIINESETRSVQVREQAASFDLESIFKYAIEKGIGSESMKDLMAIRREINGELSKKAFDVAMAEFQAECPVVTKITGVPTSTGKMAYKFAPFEHVISTVKPYLQKHGFCYTLDTDTESALGWVIAKCHVIHSSGHSMTSVAKFPLGTKTGIMSDTQVYASALTFASRRVFQNAFGIVCAGEDFNGATDNVKPQGMSAVAPSEPSLRDLAKDLWDVLKPVRGDAKNWNEANQWLWLEEILDAAAGESAPKLTPEQFRKAIKLSKERLAP